MSSACEVCGKDLMRLPFDNGCLCAAATDADYLLDDLTDEQLEYVKKLEAEAADGNAAWNTLIALAEKLEIDPEEARRKPGKPSDVYMEKLIELEAKNAKLEHDRVQLEWMAENEGIIEKHPDKDLWCVVADGLDYHTDWCSSWRAAIDQARKQK